MGPLQTNCYLLADEESREALVLDPATMSQRILEKAEELGFQVKYIGLTHGHFDHCGAMEPLAEKTGAVCVAHPRAEEIYQKPLPAYENLYGGEELFLGDLKVKVLAIPGHTVSDLAYFCDGHLFSGDTLFQGSVGRCDLPTGDGEQLLCSIRDVLFALPEETVVHCGHGADTTIGEEKRWNPYVGA